MLRVILFIAISALLSQRAYSALGDTKADAKARYGIVMRTLPGTRGEEQIQYGYKDFYILVTFIAGKSRSEYYFHRDGKSPLKPKEIQSFLTMTSQGAAWQKSRELPVWTLGGRSPETWRALAAYYLMFPAPRFRDSVSVLPITRGGQDYLMHGENQASNQSMKVTAGSPAINF